MDNQEIKQIRQIISNILIDIQDDDVLVTILNDFICDEFCKINSMFNLENQYFIEFHKSFVKEIVEENKKEQSREIRLNKFRTLLQNILNTVSEDLENFHISDYEKESMTDNVSLLLRRGNCKFCANE